MKTFLFLAGVCLVGGFFVTSIIWAVFWIAGVLTPPLAVQKIVWALIKPQHRIKVFDTPSDLESGSITDFLNSELPAEGLPIMRGTSAAAVLSTITEGDSTGVNTYAAAS